MDSKLHFANSVLFKAAMFVILLATLLVGLPPSPAKAYTGGYAVGFEGLGSVIRIDQLNPLGDDCESTKSVSLWVRPTG